MNVPIDISTVTLSTSRLTLRPFCQGDLDDFFDYASVDGVGQMAGWNPHKDKAETRIILDSFIKRKKTFALVHNGKVIGSLGIEEYDEKKYPEFADKKCRELGFVLSKAYWGQGLIPEAVNEVIRFLFEEIGLDVIFCGYFSSNRQSRRVQEKCGFRYYTSETYDAQIGTIADSILNILTKQDYLTNQIHN